jgi:molybdate transport system substrate-binding protein
VKSPIRPVALFVIAMLTAMPARADQIRLVSSVAAKAVVEALVPGFEKSTGHMVTPVFGIAADLKARVEGGEPFDVAILTAPLLDDLIASGIVSRASRAVVARSGLGFMVKAGAPKPDVSTVDGFRRALLGARALTYVTTGASGIAFVATLQKLGLADTLKARTKAAASGDDVAASIVNGTADLAVLPVSEILPVRGAELGGVFPSDLQTYVVMTAGVNARSPHATAARELVAFLTAAQNTPVIRAHGMER